MLDWAGWLDGIGVMRCSFSLFGGLLIRRCWTGRGSVCLLTVRGVCLLLRGVLG